MALVIGGTVLLLGVALLVLPGPGWLLIIGGLAILAGEFAWARWLLKHAKATAKNGLSYLVFWRRSEAATPGTGPSAGEGEDA